MHIFAASSTVKNAHTYNGKNTSTHVDVLLKERSSWQDMHYQKMGNLCGMLHTNKQTHKTHTHIFISYLHGNRRWTSLQYAPQWKMYTHTKVKHKHTSARLAKRWVILTRHAPPKDGTSLWCAAHKQTNTYTPIHSYILYTWVDFITLTPTEDAHLCSKFHSEKGTQIQRWNTSTHVHVLPKDGSSWQDTHHQRMEQLCGTLHANKQTHTTDTHTVISGQLMGLLHNTHTPTEDGHLCNVLHRKKCTHIQRLNTSSRVHVLLKDRLSWQDTHHQKMGHLCGTLHTNKQAHTTHTFISCQHMGQI